MKTVPESSPIQAYSAHNSVKPIHFFCEAPYARAVFLVGDFNNWDPNAWPMERRVDGWWYIQVPLCHGHHRYYFLVDGQPMLDPQATGVTRDAKGEEVSLVAVS